MWHVYILLCADKTLYTGATNDLARRLRIHNGEEQGSVAKYTQIRRPVRLVYSESYPNKSLALKREWAIKQLTKAKKIELITTAGGNVAV
jgi:putative endonuclease